MLTGWQIGVVRSAVSVAVGVAVLLLLASPAAAHTDLESSDPTDGAVVDAPVELITLVFTVAVEPTGDGFELLDADGARRSPSSVVSDDDITWVLGFDPPIAGGEVGLRWTVKAPDSHAITGAFSFTTPDGEAVPASTATTSPVATAPPTSVGATATTATDSTEAPEPTVAGNVLGRPDDEVAVPAPTIPAPPAAESLDDFLSEDLPGVWAQRLGAAGRFFGVMGLLLGVGGLVFGATVVRNDHGDLSQVLSWVRGGALFVVLGAIIDFGAQVVTGESGAWSALWSGSAISDVATTTFGTATALRIVGGVALFIGARLVAAARAGDVGWPAGPLPVVAALGAGAVVLAHLFDGHTVTEGNRVVTALADLTHVAAAAVWGGGALLLALIVRRHRSEGTAARTREVAARFSVVATATLAATAVAGVALTVIVVSSPSDLWSTDWGRTLLAKIVVVVAVVSAGAYNHFVLVPQMAAASVGAGAEDVGASALRFRRVITWEAAGFVVIALLTALLMGAAT